MLLLKVLFRLAICAFYCLQVAQSGFSQDMAIIRVPVTSKVSVFTIEMLIINEPDV